MVMLQLQVQDDAHTQFVSHKVYKAQIAQAYRSCMLNTMNLTSSLSSLMYLYI